jgi:type I restriction enzyme S subunit
MTEGPYKLPKGWRWVRLGEVAYRESKTIKPAEEPSKIFRYLGMEHLDAGQWEEPIYVELEGAMIKSQAIMFYPGMVLYGKLRPYLNKVVIPTVEGVASTEFVPLLTHNNFLIPEYLGAYLRSPFFVSYASRNTSGSRQPRVQFGAFWDALIPLPPISEQKRIVERINDLFSRIREAKRLRQEAQQEAERLWKSVLADTFPKPGTKLPEDWKWVKLGEIAEEPQYGYTESASSVPIGPKFLRITDITSGEVNWEAVPYCRCDSKNLERYKLQSGDILFARSGSIGATILIKDVPRQAIFASYLIRVRLHKGILPEFVSMALKSPICQSQLVPQGATQKNINAKLIKSLSIPLAPILQQKRIVAYLEALQDKIKFLKEAQAQTEAELQSLEQAILDKAFLGEL